MIRKFINQILIFLKLKKSFVRPVLDSEKKILKSAKLKNFKPTVKCLQKLALGGKFEIQLTYNTLDEKTNQENFPIEILNNREQGLRSFNLYFSFTDVLFNLYGKCIVVYFVQ